MRSLIKTAFACLGLLFMTASPSYATENGRAATGPAMWTVKTGTATVTLLGSFHILPPDMDWRDARIDQALKDADAVYFEIDDREMDKPGVQQRVMGYAMLPEGTSLSALLSPAVHDQLSRASAALGIPAGSLDPMKPWFAATTLVVIDMMTSGMSPEDGVDATLTRAAIAAGKPVRAFETIDQQMQILDSLSAIEPDFMIAETLRYLGDSETLDKTLHAWATGDTAALEILLLEELRAYEGVYDTFLTDRNRAWITQIEAAMEDGGIYFVVVGAGHLVGPDSVIEMLKDKGYQVERY